MTITNHEPSDAARRYMEQTRPAHALLCDSLTQIAGHTLLMMIGSRSIRMADLPIHVARAVVGRTAEDLRALRVPAEASHHFHHMCKAAEAIEDTFGLIESCRTSEAEGLRQQLIRLLRNAADHLRSASRLLPGHPMADLSQACCAHHMRTMINRQ